MSGIRVSTCGRFAASLSVGITTLIESVDAADGNALSRSGRLSVARTSPVASVYVTAKLNASLILSRLLPRGLLNPPAAGAR